MDEAIVIGKRQQFARIRVNKLSEIVLYFDKEEREERYFKTSELIN